MSCPVQIASKYSIKYGRNYAQFSGFTVYCKLIIIAILRPNRSLQNNTKYIIILFHDVLHNSLITAFTTMVKRTIIQTKATPHNNLFKHNLVFQFGSPVKSRRVTCILSDTHGHVFKDVTELQDYSFQYTCNAY